MIRVCHSPAGRVLHRLCPRQGWALAYATAPEPTSLRTGRALTGPVRWKFGRQGDDTPKGRCRAPFGSMGELAAPNRVRQYLQPFASQLGTHFSYPKAEGGISDPTDPQLSKRLPYVGNLFRGHYLAGRSGCVRL